MPRLLASELPVVAEVRHHPITMFRPVSKWAAIALVVLVLLALLWPWPWALLFTLVVGTLAFYRWREWEVERVIITQQRIIRTRGLPETTTTEASLRLDRVSGAVLEQSLFGRWFNYATIELEASGSHPDFRKLKTIERPLEFYSLLRQAIFVDGPPDPDDEPRHFNTAPIPRLPRVWRGGRR